MNPFHAWIQDISFKYLKPEQAFSQGLTLAALLSLGNRLGMSFEKINTELPGLALDLNKKLTKLCKIPKASTYALGAVINKAVSCLKSSEVFLNIGVWHGFTFLAGVLNNPDKKCIAVDNFSLHRKVKADGSPEYRGAKKFFYLCVDQWAKISFLRRFKQYTSNHHFFYEMDYVEYFKSVHREPIGFYIYDAQHRYSHQFQALELAEPFLAKEAILLIDDTNALDNRRATLDFIAQSRHGYQILYDRRTYCNRHPTLWNGVMVLQKMD